MEVWLQRVVDKLLSQAQHFSHALCLQGQAGLGLLSLAQELSRFLLCQQPSASGACLQCRSCHLREQHPDLLYVDNAASQVIKIDQIRNAIAFSQQTAQFSGNRVVIIDGAEKMNTAAQNALLKTLEEPSDDFYLLLVTSHAAKLLATVKSRCQLVTCLPPSAKELQAWAEHHFAAEHNEIQQLLRSCQGSPLQALQWHEAGFWAQRQQICDEFIRIRCQHSEASQVSLRWSKLDIPSLLKVLMSLISDCCKLRLTTERLAIVNQDYAVQLQQLSSELSLSALFKLYDNVLQLLNYYYKQANVNTQLSLDVFLAAWRSL